jgi:2-amino-4-hydroxy-6-hydroxymethyldihydropteridine diphosphokinase
MNRIFLSIGSNLGDRSQNLKKGIDLLVKLAGRSGAVSSIYETEPWGCDSQLNFYNQVIELYTHLGPLSLLDVIHNTEKMCGRDRPVQRYAPRTLDVDILLYGDSVIEIPELVIPHPHIQDRQFVLVPLTEIAPHVIHPILNKNMEQLLRECKDEKKVILLTSGLHRPG